MIGVKMCHRSKLYNTAHFQTWWVTLICSKWQEPIGQSTSSSTEAAQPPTIEAFSLCGDETSPPQ